MHSTTDHNSTQRVPARQFSLPFDDRPGQSTHRRRRKRAPERRVSDASLQSLPARECRSRLHLTIAEVLSRCGSELKDGLTARQVLRVLKELRVLPPEAGRNATSPRLSEMLDAGLVENLADPINPDRPYLKRVGSDAAAMTWRLTPRGRLLLDGRGCETARCAGEFEKSGA